MPPVHPRRRGMAASPVARGAASHSATSARSPVHPRTCRAEGTQTGTMKNGASSSLGVQGDAPGDCVVVRNTGLTLNAQSGLAELRRAEGVCGFIPGTRGPDGSVSTLRNLAHPDAQGAPQGHHGHEQCVGFIPGRAGGFSATGMTSDVDGSFSDVPGGPDVHQGGPLQARLAPGGAGRTAAADRQVRAATVHPWARGVPSSSFSASATMTGSSPDSRGSRSARNRRGRRDRFIPGRAGFPP